jgi:hypothetical protein
LVLFAKYQESLDSLSQGTGIGLCLSKKLMKAMGGDLALHDSYNSGVEGSPGACFVLELNVPPMSLEGYAKSDSTREPIDMSSTSGCRQQTDSDENDIEACLPGGLNGLVSTETDISSGILPEELSVLFVDDDAVLRKLFMRAVRRIGPGWSIQGAASGEVCLILCDENSFDLIF